MAFVHNGRVWFPENPLLTINDHWLGIDGDEGRILLLIDGSDWSKRCQIVEIANWCFGLVDPSGNFPRLNPVAIGDGVVKYDNTRWVASNGATLSYTLDGWKLESSTFGDGNYYSFNWNRIRATPQGPWVDEDDPPSRIDFQLDWPRWECTSTSSYGTPNPIDNYIPASTHCVSPPSGNIRVGCPTWTDSQLGTVTRTSQYTDWDNHLYSYLFANGSGFKPDPEDNTKVIYEANGTDYKGPIPTPDQSWTVTYKDSEGETQTKTFTAGSWVKGNDTVKRKMFEIARLV